MKKVSIFGATGSIGQSTIKVIQAQPEQYDVQVLTAHSNVEQLAKDARDLKAKYAVISDEACHDDLRQALSDTDIKVMAGRDALIEAASIPADWIMAAIVGVAGLEPLMPAIAQGTSVAIANKEPLVSAGPIILEAARQSGATLLPTDSEHNAIFQVFDASQKQSIERIILTASGGPFRTMPIDQMSDITVEQALAHPTWSMGDKISIDSATMMNKALEVIEAQRLFDMPKDQIEVLVHPQSVVHSMVEYSDGSILTQMGASDMCTPIANALGWPERISSPGEKLDLNKLSRLDFEAVDHDKFPFVRMAYDCLDEGLGSCLAMNAANEIAVQAFLDRKIAFLDIYSVVKDVVEQSAQGDISLNTVEEVTEYDNIVRELTESVITNNHSLTRTA